MNKAYQKMTFVNDQEPDLDAENLNSISNAIDTIDDRVVQHETDIASKMSATNPTASGTMTVNGSIGANTINVVNANISGIALGRDNEGRLTSSAEIKAEDFSTTGGKSVSGNAAAIESVANDLDSLTRTGGRLDEMQLSIDSKLGSIDPTITGNLTVNNKITADSIQASTIKATYEGDIVFLKTDFITSDQSYIEVEKETFFDKDIQINRGNHNYKSLNEFMDETNTSLGNQVAISSSPLENSTYGKISGIRYSGSSYQDGTPTVANPIWIKNSNLLIKTTNSLDPNVEDYVETSVYGYGNNYMADGSAKITHGKYYNKSHQLVTDSDWAVVEISSIDDKREYVITCNSVDNNVASCFKYNPYGWHLLFTRDSNEFEHIIPCFNTNLSTKLYISCLESELDSIGVYQYNPCRGMNGISDVVDIDLYGDSTHTKRFDLAVFNANNVEWGRYQTLNCYFCDATDIMSVWSRSANLLCNMSDNILTKTPTSSSGANEVHVVNSSGHYTVYVMVDDSITSLEEWKNKLNNTPLQIMYERYTPSVKHLLLEETDRIKALETFQPTTYVETELENVVVKYPINIKDYVDAQDKALSDRVSKNEYDIEILKNRPSGGGSDFILSSPSPLQNTTASNIIGIDVSGKSEQKTTKEVQFKYVYGMHSTSSGFGYYANTIGADNDVIPCAVGDTYKITISLWSGAVIWVGYYDSSKGFIERVAINNGDTITIPSGASFFFVSVYANNITATSYPTVSVMGTKVSPTPTNPIPIVDASGEIVAKTKNLIDDSTISTRDWKKLDGTKLATVSCYRANIKPNTEYTLSRSVAFSGTGWTNVFDANGNALYLGTSEGGKTSVTIPSFANASYIYVYNPNDGIKMQLEEGTTATDYVPYASNSISLPITLRSVETVADTLVINKDGSGKLTQRVTSKLLNGTENWSLQSINSSGIANFTITLTDSTTEFGNATPSLCSHFIQQTSSISATTTEGYMLNGQRAFFIRINSTIANTVETFKSWLSSNNVTLYYALATPIETSLTAEQVSSILALKTYNGTTIIDSELDVNSVCYSGDVKAYVDSKTDYSYTDQIIGKWADGKDLHRMVIQTNTPFTLNSGVKVADFPEGAILKHLYGTVETTEYYLPINLYIGYGGYNVATWVNYAQGSINMAVSIEAYKGKPCEIIVEYTFKDASRMVEPMLLSEGGEE